MVRLALLGGLLLSVLFVALAVHSGYFGTGVFAVYLVSISLAWIVLAKRRGQLTPGVPTPPSWRAIAPIAVLVVLQLALARHFSSFPLHFQHDEFITAYTSWELPDLFQMQWFVGYPEKGNWVSQFPILFHALQKPFFLVLGPTVDAVRMSTWPYLALTAVYLYLLARELSPDPVFAFAAGVCGIVFAPHLYLASLGVHFHSSMLFLTASVYYLVRLLRLERRIDALLCGLFAALAYLTYTSSYITLPLLVGFVALESLVRRSTRPIRLFLPALAIFAVVMLPFVVSALTKDNFFLQRVEQINTLSGDDYGKPALERGDEALAFFLDHVSNSVKALYEAGYVAKETGYLFGKQALFSPLSLVLFALGSLAGLYRAVFRGERGFILVSVAILVAFISGMILTMPAGGLHRLSVVYPLIGLSIAAGTFIPAMTLDRVVAARFRCRLLFRVAALALVLAFCAVSLSRGQQMVDPDQTHDSPYIAQFIEANVPRGEPVAIAHVFNYHLARELFFRSGGRPYATIPLWLVVDDPSYAAVVLAYPAADTLGFAKAGFPKAQYFSEVDGVPLKDHVIVLIRGTQSGGEAPQR